MGQSTFPVPSSGSSTSTVLPVNASSVILDGSLTSASTYTTTVNGNGGIAYLTASTNNATITIGGTAYSVPAGSTKTSGVFGASTSVTVAAQLGGFPTSSSSFTSITMPSASYWTGFAYGNISGTNYWVAISQSSSGAYSTNGTSWTATSLAYNQSWTNVAYGNSTFVAVQSSAGSATGIYSINGTSWSGMTMASNTNWDDVTYGNGYFVAVGRTTVSNYSTNGTTWTLSSLTSSQTWMGVSAGNGIYVAVSQTTVGNYSTSTSGPTTWNTNTMPSSGLNRVAFGNGYFVATHGGGNAAYSTNGASWTVGGSAPSGDSYQFITYQNGLFMMSNNSGTTNVAWSTNNGITWSEGAYLPSATSSYGIGSGNGTFIVGLGSSNPGLFTQSAQMPVNFGIYAGPTTIN
jgi:hypothetical protein